MTQTRWAGSAYADDDADAETRGEQGPVDTSEPELPENVPVADGRQAAEDQVREGVEEIPAPPPVIRPSTDLATVRTRAEQRRASRGWRGAVRRATRGLVAPRASEAEVGEIRDRQAVNAQWARTKTVVVANPKGSAAKTITTAQIAATFGQVRGGSSVAWDNNETLGTLGIRTTPSRFPTTAVDLLENLHRFERIDAKKGELSAFVRAQESGQYHVLASDEDPRRMSQIGATEFTRIHTVLTRYYDVIAVDTGNNPRAANFLAALEVADVLVIPLSWSEDKVRTAGRLIDQLRQTGYEDLVARAITVVTGRAATEATVDKIAAWREWFTEQTAVVLDIPYDKHLDGGHVIVHDELAPRTRRAYLAVAARVADAFTEAEQARAYRSIKGEDE